MKRCANRCELPLFMCICGKDLQENITSEQQLAIAFNYFLIYE